MENDLAQLSGASSSVLVKDLYLKYKLSTSNCFDTTSEQTEHDSIALASKSFWTPLQTKYANTLATAITIEDSWHKHELLLQHICSTNLSKFKYSPAVLQYTLDQNRHESGTSTRQQKTEALQATANTFLKGIAALETYLTDHSIKTVSVVGNSPSVLENENGESIDSADCVIRFNNTSHSDKYLKHTGCKTDIWVTSPGYQFRGEESCQSNYVCLSGYFPYKRVNKYWHLLNHQTNADLLEFSSAVWPELTKELQAPPSSGLQCLTALSRSNLQIKAYGFTLDREKESRNDKNHFRDSQRRSTRHNWQAESSLLRKLAHSHVEFL